jgi:hypothetical protein
MPSSRLKWRWTRKKQFGKRGPQKAIMNNIASKNYRKRCNIKFIRLGGTEK